MDKIIELSDKIDTISNINDKIKLIKSLNEMIEIEKKNLNSINNASNIIKTKIPIKYKKMSIDELENEFEKCNNINEKILIYSAIDKYYSNIEEELFEIE
jgi:hypothetical protein